MSPTSAGVTIPTINDNPGEADAGTQVFQPGHTYTISVDLEHTNGPNVVGCALCNVVSESRSSFDYTAIDPTKTPLPVGATVNLPTDFTPIPTTSGTFNPILYNFSVNNVSPDSVTYIDPVAADAFIYTIGAGDPNFKSVDPLTDVGNGIYKLYVWDGTEFVLLDSGLAADSTFDFTANGFADGVSEFEIAGLDPGVDPTDITAFVTGLKFMADGDFTGTMEAVVETTQEVPEPATLSLFGSGLVAFIVTKRRRNKRGSAKRAVADPKNHCSRHLR